MEEGNPLTALAATGSVASRFVTQTEIDSAKERREADWKAAYARLGQEPPPKPTEDPEYDGRSLYERLQANKIAKQEQWEEQSKLSNQFRALEEDEIHFLDSLVDEKIVKEQKRKDEENEELKHYRDAVNQRASQQSAAPVPPTPAAKPPPAKATASAKSQPKKNQKTLLKGAIVRKSNAPASSAASPSSSAAAATKTADTVKGSTITTTPASKSGDLATQPSSPLAKNASTVGQKRSESSTSEATGELSEDAQSAKRQKSSCSHVNSMSVTPGFPV